MTKNKIYKQEDIAYIIKRYQEGDSCTQLGQMYGVGTSTISRLLKRNNINVVNRQNLVSYTDEEIINDYCNLGLTLSQIAKNRNTTIPLLSRKLKAKGIDVINYHNDSKFNEHVFDIIDTEEKAYWLGFIYADGYIANIEKQKNQKKLKYGFELSLSFKDIEHLHKFNKFMEYKGDNVKIGKSKLGDKNYQRCRWGVGNKHLWTTLNSLGCTPNKSLTLKFPELSIFKNKYLILPFIRGYFDGDGCVSKYNRNGKTRFTVSLLGTLKMLTPIRNLFFKENKLTRNNKNNDITLVYALSGQKAYTFLSIIYNNATIYLDRKYQKFKELKNCRSEAKALELLEGKIGEGWDADPELIANLNDLQQCNA